MKLLPEAQSRADRGITSSYFGNADNKDMRVYSDNNM
jgi:hypothetical protein